MATVLRLVEEGKLFKFDASLDWDVQEVRRIYISPKLMGWMEGTLPTLGSDRHIEETPAEQLDAILAIYASGETLNFTWHINSIQPGQDGVWEIKCPDIRVFGWFSMKDCFIGVVANSASHIKTYDLYTGYQGEVVRFRDRLGLEYVPGRDPHDVVSNYSFSD